MTILITERRNNILLKLLKNTFLLRGELQLLVLEATLMR